jgi:hypothetical protein
MLGGGAVFIQRAGCIYEVLSAIADILVFFFFFQSFFLLPHQI